MKLPFARIASFLKKPDPSVRVILVYGPDTGLVQERTSALAKIVCPNAKDPFCAATLASASIAATPALLMDEMASVSLGGGRRLVRVPGAGEEIGPALKTLLENMPNADSVLLIEAGDLPKKSKLRGLCEGETPLAAGIPCYIEDSASRQKTITEILAAEGIAISRDVCAALADVMPPDRLAMRSELEKFAVYVGKGNNATMADVHACVQDAGAAEMDDLVFAVGAGESARALQLIDRLYAEQMAPVALLRAAQRHFIRLQWARAEMDKGIGATDAVKRLQPPVFWKYESAMASQLRRWSVARSQAALRRLYDAEASVKSTGTPDLALCAQTLLALAA